MVGQCIWVVGIKCYLKFDVISSRKVFSHSPLNDQWLSLWNLRPPVHNPNSGPASWRWWFYDPFYVTLIIVWPHTTQLLQIVRDDKGAWHKSKLLLAMTRHQDLQIPPDAIFATNLKGSGYVVDLLVRAECFETGTLHMFAPNTHPVVGLCKWNKR